MAAVLERLEHAFFAGGFRLLFGQIVARIASDRIQADDVLAAKVGDGSSENGFAAGAEAEFPGNVRGDVLGGRAAHQLQRLADFAVGKNVEEGGLFEIDGEGLLEGAVEDRVAGGVDEVGEDDGVFLGEGCSFRHRSCRPRAQVERSPDGGSDKYYGGGNQNLPEFSARDRSFGNFFGNLHCAR